MSVETRAWYLDEQGVERECIVVRSSGFVNAVLSVLDLNGQPIDVDRESLYYVPKHAEDPPE